MKEQENKIIPALKNTICADFGDIGGDLIELGIDDLMENELIKNIPIVKTVTALCKTGLHLAERHFLKETLIFILELNNSSISNEKKQKYQKRFNENPKYAEKELERITLLLNSHIYSSQSQRLANFYCAYINEAISWGKFCELSEANSRLFESDYNLLSAIYNGQSCKDNYQAARLASIGLLQDTGPSLDNGDLIIGESTYSCSSFGKTFMQHTTKKHPKI